MRMRYVTLALSFFLFFSSFFLSARVSIEEIDALMQNSERSEKGPRFGETPVDFDKNYTQTPMGSYLKNWFSAIQAPREQLEQATKKILDLIANSRTCQERCSDDFRSKIYNNKEALLERLREVVVESLNNEINNSNKFNVFYHGFPNDFRLYQDVLREIKSFEFLTKLDNTYVFRDFSFDDNKLNIQAFLKNWWPAYLEYTTEKNTTPFPPADVERGNEEYPGAGFGLTFYPDSITYAQKYLLATNLNLLANNISPMNSSVYFFLNSSSATGLDIVDMLLKQSLRPYIKSSSKLDVIINRLKNIFDESMSKSGGQLAQIFVDKKVSPELSFMAWNGGEPMWLSRSSGAIAINLNKPKLFRPPNILSLDTLELQQNYQILDVVDFMNIYIQDSPVLLDLFSTLPSKRLQAAANITGESPNSETNKIFYIQDSAQARVLPNPEYFSDQKVVGVKLFTLNKIAQEEEEEYRQKIAQVIHDVMSEFLAEAHSAEDFKAGDFKLKEVFLKQRSPEN